MVFLTKETDIMGRNIVIAGHPASIVKVLGGNKYIVKDMNGTLVPVDLGEYSPDSINWS